MKGLRTTACPWTSCIPLTSACRTAYPCRTTSRLDQAKLSGFGGKEIRDRGRIYAWNTSLRKWRGASTSVALIPFRPGSLIENPRCGVIQRRFEVVVSKILLEDFNIFISGVGHRVGQKAQGEFQRFFRSSKPEDAFRKGRKFVGKVTQRTQRCTRYIKEGGCASRDLTGKSCRANSLQCGAFFATAPQMRHMEKRED